MAIADITAIYINFVMGHLPRSAAMPARIKLTGIAVNSVLGQWAGTLSRVSARNVITTTPLEAAGPMVAGDERSEGTTSDGAGIQLKWTPSLPSVEAHAIVMSSNANAPALVTVEVIVQRTGGRLVHLKPRVWGSAHAAVYNRVAGTIYNTALPLSHTDLTIPLTSEVSELDWDDPYCTREFPYGGKLKTCFVLKNQYGLPANGYIQIAPKLNFPGEVRDRIPMIQTFKVCNGELVRFANKAPGTYTVVATPVGDNMGSAIVQDFTLES